MPIDARGIPELVLKPSRGGSSVGVSVARGEAAAASAAVALGAAGAGRVVVEGFVRGQEFTVIVLGGSPEGTGGPAVALVPTEVELRATPDRLGETWDSAGEDAAGPSSPRGGTGVGQGIFGFREKYLPSTRVALHTPPRHLSAATTADIRRSAERVFRELGLRDFARLDGKCPYRQFQFTIHEPLLSYPAKCERQLHLTPRSAHRIRFQCCCRFRCPRGFTPRRPHPARDAVRSIRQECLLALSPAAARGCGPGSGPPGDLHGSQYD